MAKIELDIVKLEMTQAAGELNTGMGGTMLMHGRDGRRPGLAARGGL